MSMEIEFKKPIFPRPYDDIDWIKKTNIFIQPKEIKVIEFNNLKLFPLEKFFAKKAEKEQEKFLRDIEKILRKLHKHKL